MDGYNKILGFLFVWFLVAYTYVSWNIQTPIEDISTTKPIEDISTTSTLPRKYKIVDYGNCLFVNESVFPVDPNYNSYMDEKEAFEEKDRLEKVCLEISTTPASEYPRIPYPETVYWARQGDIWITTTETDIPADAIFGYDLDEFKGVDPSEFEASKHPDYTSLSADFPRLLSIAAGTVSPTTPTTTTLAPNTTTTTTTLAPTTTTTISVDTWWWADNGYYSPDGVRYDYQGQIGDVWWWADTGYYSPDGVRYDYQGQIGDVWWWADTGYYHPDGTRYDFQGQIGNVWWWADNGYYHPDGTRYDFQGQIGSGLSKTQESIIFILFTILFRTN